MLQTPAGDCFTTSWLTYQEDATESMPAAYRRDDSQKIYIPIILPDLNERYTALLDTGAPYVVLAKNLVAALGDKVRTTGVRKRLLTRHGPIDGEWGRIELELPAEEGHSLKVDATAFYCDWPDEDCVVLGYMGFLQRIRFGIDSVQCRFYFGQADE